MTGNSDSAPRRPRRVRPWMFALQVAVSAGLLAWLVGRIGLRDILAQLAGMNARLYALAALIYLVSIAIRAYRWQVMLAPLGVKASLPTLFRLYLLGYFWNSFLPTGFGGDVAKVVALQRHSGQGIDSMTSVIAERLVGLLGTSLVGLAVLLAWPRLVPAGLLALVAAVCVGIIAAGWIIRLDILGWLASALPFTRPAVTHPKVVAFHRAVRAYDARAFALGILASLPFTLAFILTNWLIGLALHVPIPPRYYAAFTPIVSVVEVLPLSFNGLGVREYLYQLLFQPVGVTAGQAVAMGLGFNLIKIGTGVLGGVVALLGGARGLLQSSRAGD